MKIVIIGAGYAGTVAANRLAKKLDGADVTVVNPRVEFVERVRLHQLIAGTGGEPIPLDEMLDPSVTLRVGTVEKVGDGSVRLADGTELPFDRLVYAGGASAASPAGTFAVGGVDSARTSAGRVAALGAGAVVDVVGGGLTGIETAAEVASVRPDLTVRLISDVPIGGSLGERARAQIARRLDGLGVQVRIESWSAPSADVTLWAVAGAVGDGPASLGLAVDADGRIEVDEFLRSTTDQRIYAAGDAAAVPGSRQSCQAALPQGAYVADCIVREAAGKGLTPFSMSFVGQNVSLGRRDGVIQVSRRDDSPTRWWVGGRAQGAGLSGHRLGGAQRSVDDDPRSAMTGDPAGSEVFTEHRALLFSIAYEVLGSVVDAEDAVSETWLRWSAVDHASVENPRAYLARIVTRQALNAARASARRREDYVGPWLPEPLETGAVEGDPTVEHVLTGEAVTTAMLLVLESLTPVERVVFVLREVFDFGYPEIAAAVDKSEAAVRQVAHRARGHVSARRSVAVASPTDAQVVAETFMAAALTGDVQALMDVLAPDAVSIGDGGGVKNAARRPVEGAEKVARFVVGLVGMSGRYGEMSLRPAVVNGMPSFVVSFDGDVDTVISVEVRGGLVSALYAVRNPHKLSGMPR